MPSAPRQPKTSYSCFWTSWPCRLPKAFFIRSTIWNVSKVLLECVHTKHVETADVGGKKSICTLKPLVCREIGPCYWLFARILSFFWYTVCFFLNSKGKWQTLLFFTAWRKAPTHKQESYHHGTSPVEHPTPEGNPKPLGQSASFGTCSHHPGLILDRCTEGAAPSTGPLSYIPDIGCNPS